MRSVITCFLVVLALLFPTLSFAVTLTSSAFANNGVIPNEFTYSLNSQCSGSNLSPPLTISDIPAGTQSFALTVVDPDGGNWVHWKAWNISAATTILPENVSVTATFDQAVNDFGAIGYGGPCPPTPNHRYVFTLYALNTTFATEPTATQLEGAALATTTLSGMRSPSDNMTASQISSRRMFTFAEANYPTIFTGTATEGQYQQYNYRYYSASGNYLAVDASEVVYVLGPFTGNVIISVGSMESLMGSVATWETVSKPYTMSFQDVSGNCTLYNESFEGVLTPTDQANTYTTVFVGGTAITLTIPGNNGFDFSYAEGMGMTSDRMQLTFDSQSRTVYGSSNWAHTNGCHGVTTIVGSW